MQQTSKTTIKAAVLAAFLLLSVLAAGSTVFAQEKRVALVIGNGAYRYNTTLKNPVNDATDMASALRSAGFEVIVKTDAGLDAMHTAVRDFGSRLKETRGTGLFFYSGHGTQVKGRNYLLPVDMDIQDADEVAYKALDAESVLAKMESAGNGLNLVFLDACRNNPFPGSSRTGDKGLAIMNVDLPESVIVYAAEPGKTAEDGSGGSRNSPFTQSLLSHMKTPGQDILDLMRKVKAEVSSVTSGRQSPRVDQNLSKYFYFYTGVAQPASTGTMTVVKTYGAISITVKEGAKIYVEGAYKGAVPGNSTATITGVETGSRKVEAHYADGKSEAATVNVTANGTGYAYFSYVKPAPAVTQPAASAKTLAIGDTHAGGIIFYLDGKGGGLVAAPSDQSAGSDWGGFRTTVGGTFTAVGTGAANTKKIIQVLGGKAVAAKICDDLTLNGYSDWFLPSKDELNLMYQNLKKKNVGGFAGSNYWSSSEDDGHDAWYQYFENGSQYGNFKSSRYGVRAVRAF